MTQNAATASVPMSVVSNTMKAASFMAAGESAAVGLSASVAALTHGVIKTMVWTKLKFATTLFLMIVASTAGGLLYYSQAIADDGPGQGQPSRQDLREAAIKALEQFASSKKEADRELAIKALTEFGQRWPDPPSTNSIARSGKGREEKWDSIASRLKHRIRVETGYTEFRDGGRIEILEVWGTRPQIEVGGQYLVHGKYKLPPGQRAKFYFYTTASGAEGATATTLDLQTLEVDKPEGDFTLMHGMSAPGYFHLILADPERYSQAFANVYFGTGDNVWRKKP
jgi:hypothetical protein